MKTKGFTLVELLVVIAILAILATVSVVGYTSFIDRAEQSNADTEMHQIETTINSYNIAGQTYVIGKVDTAEYVAVVLADGTVELWAKANVGVEGKTAESAVPANFVWTDFEEVKANLSIVGGKLAYKYGDSTKNIDLND